VEEANQRAASVHTNYGSARDEAENGMTESKKENDMKSIFQWSIVGLGLAAIALLAQNPGLQRTIVTTADVSVPGREAVIAHVEIAPGAGAGRHTHPGEEISYVEEGEGELLIEGQPARKLKTGDGFVVPSGLKHDARNTGTRVLKVVAVYLVEKGKPLATPAP
jgi:quercetin dioxygenase-like cupin family protein